MKRSVMPPLTHDGMREITRRKIKMLKLSIRCFQFGMLALIPYIGLFFALLALFASVAAGRQEKYFWNAARSYRRIGTWCGIAMTILWSCAWLYAIYSATQGSND